MKLSQLLNGLQVIGSLADDPEITGITADSRKVSAGTLFVAMPSERTNTLDYIEDAAAKGAVAVLVSERAGVAMAADHGVTPVLLPNIEWSFNASVGLVCREFFGDPTLNMRVIGITGTNGKTTTAWMMRQALSELGRNVAYLGTLGIHYGDIHRELSNTTPFPVELWTLLAEIRDAGCTDLVMEASSHALEQKRLWGVRFDAGIFTNLTQDHLDFHGSMEAYSHAKKKLFTEYAEASEKNFVGAINGSDPIGRSWLGTLPETTISFGPSATFEVRPRTVTVDRIVATLGKEQFEVGVGGLFNVENLNAAGAGLSALGYSEAQIVQALTKITPVPGRFEAVSNSHGIGVLVDYAHTPDALEKVLSSARALKPKRLIVVFGCGGDRDRTKRPKMAGVTCEFADFSVVTSDNPRTEDPVAILDDITQGFKFGRPHTVIVDRREAIHYAINMAKPGEIVVIAGKGHENYQIIGHTKHPMDDRLIAAEALASPRGGTFEP